VSKEELKKGDLVLFAKEFDAWLPYNTIEEFLTNSSEKIPAGTVGIFLGRSEIFEEYGLRVDVGKWFHVLCNNKVLLVDSDAAVTHVKKVTDPKQVAQFVRGSRDKTPL